MSRGLFAKLGRLLRWPLFGTFVVPKDARVDPALFPEEEFPVFCPKCRYLLRGLPDGVCPECGKPFERGALLVRQYVFGKQLWRRTSLGRLGHRCLVAGLVCIFAPYLAVLVPLLLQNLGVVDLEAVSAGISITWAVRLALAAFLLVVLLGFGLMLAAGSCSVVDHRRMRYGQKRRAIIATIRAAREGRIGNDVS